MRPSSAPGSRWYVARLSASNPSSASNFITKGPGFLDPRWPDGGTPVTYPGSGASFALPLLPPYTSVTVVICGGSWAQFNTNGARPLWVALGCWPEGVWCGRKDPREHVLHGMQGCKFALLHPTGLQALAHARALNCMLPVPPGSQISTSSQVLHAH